MHRSAPNVARSAEDVVDVETVVSLKDATVFVPLSKDTITDTGVPSHLVVPYTGKAKSTSYYICTYPTCEPPKGFVQKAAAHNHLRRAHLGHALGCLYCVGWRVWRIQGWKEHMLTKHSSLPQFPTGTMLEGLRKIKNGFHLVGPNLIPWDSRQCVCRIDLARLVEQREIIGS